MFLLLIHSDCLSKMTDDNKTPNQAPPSVEAEEEDRDEDGDNEQEDSEDAEDEQDNEPPRPKKSNDCWSLVAIVGMILVHNVMIHYIQSSCTKL